MGRRKKEREASPVMSLNNADDFTEDGGDGDGDADVDTGVDDADGDGGGDAEFDADDGDGDGDNDDDDDADAADGDDDDDNLDGADDQDDDDDGADVDDAADLDDNIDTGDGDVFDETVEPPVDNEEPTSVNDDEDFAVDDNDEPKAFPSSATEGVGDDNRDEPAVQSHEEVAPSLWTQRRQAMVDDTLVLLANDTLFKAIVEVASDLLTEMIEDMCLQVYAEFKIGEGAAANPISPNPSTAGSGVVSVEWRDAKHDPQLGTPLFPRTKPVGVTCPNCGDAVASSRFAPHLSRCMGHHEGRGSRRFNVAPTGVLHFAQK